MPRRLHRGRAARGPDRRRARPTGWSCTATTSRPRSWPPPCRSGWAASSSTPSTRSTASSAWWPTRPRSTAAPRTPSRPSGGGPRCWPGSPRASRSTPTSSCAPARRTRSSGSAWPRGRRPGPSTRLAALDAAGVVEFVGIHAHLGSQVFALEPVRPGHRRAGRLLRPARPARAGGGRRARRGLRQRRAGAAHGRVGGSRCAPPAAGPGSPTRSGSPPSPAAPSWPPPGVTLYRVGTVKDVPGHRTYVSVDGGMSDNPRPVLYGSGYEAFLPREAGRRPPGADPAGGQALRDGRRGGGRGVRARRPGRRRRPVHAGDRRLRPLDGLQLQQGAAARPWSSWPTARPGRWSAGRPSTTWSASTSDRPGRRRVPRPRR